MYASTESLELFMKYCAYFLGIRFGEHALFYKGARVQLNSHIVLFLRAVDTASEMEARKKALERAVKDANKCELSKLLEVLVWRVTQVRDIDISFNPSDNNGGQQHKTCLLEFSSY